MCFQLHFCNTWSMVGSFEFCGVDHTASRHCGGGPQVAVWPSRLPSPDKSTGAPLSPAGVHGTPYSGLQSGGAGERFSFPPTVAYDWVTRSLPVGPTCGHETAPMVLSESPKCSSFPAQNLSPLSGQPWLPSTLIKTIHTFYQKLPLLRLQVVRTHAQGLVLSPAAPSPLRTSVCPAVNRGGGEYPRVVRRIGRALARQWQGVAFSSS